MLVVVNFAATQYVAARFQYQDALGYPASRTQSGVGIYEPFAWMIWGFHNSTSQDPRVRRPLFEGEMIVFFGSILCVGLFYVAAGRRSRRLMQNADDLHGSARWATEADVRATGLMDAEEGGQRSDLQNIANRGASRIIHTVCYCAVAIASLQAQSSTAGSLTRLYVEPFTTKSGSERFRADLIAELRKVRSISLVPAASNTAASLAGGGEIWIKGYRSLNPRNRMPSDATVVYGGFMSVELKNANGETVWSDLVTPGGATEDISKDLSKRIAKDVAEALQAEIQPAPTTTRPKSVTVLKGAGATFPCPVYAKWITNYKRQNPNLQITYDSVGSEAGVRRLLAGQVDFGASDNPEAIREIAPAQTGNYSFFPSVIGAVVPIVNLPGFPADIAFTPDALAGIYLGRIKKWNDPLLQKANPRLHLPDLDITVVHRADGSGTTYAWTDYLSRTSSEWKSSVGASLAPRWPTGQGADGNEGVAALVKESGGSIGYVEFIYALQHHLSFGSVRNRNGEFVSASLESMATAVRQSLAVRDDLTISIVNPPGTGVYPIASFTWFVLPTHIEDEVKRNALVGFLRWMLGPGQRQAAALGYLALPADVVSREESAIDKIH